MATQTSANYTELMSNQIVRGISLGILLWILSPPTVNRSIASLLLITGVVLWTNGRDWYQAAGRELAIVGVTAAFLGILRLGNLLESMFGEITIPY